MRECKDCGYRTENEQQETNCPMCGKAMEQVDTQQLTADVNTTEQPDVETMPTMQPKKNGRGGFVGGIVTIAVIVIARIFGGFLGGEVAKNFSENKESKKMDAFIEKVEKYKPGTFTDEEYASEFWNLRWKLDENWKRMTDYELNKMGIDSKNSALRSAEITAKQEGVSEKLVEKFKNTVYGKVEAGYSYSIEGSLIATAQVMVYSAYGIEETENSAEEFVAEFSERLKNTTTGTAVLGDEEYQYIDGKYQHLDTVGTAGVNEINMRVYIRTEGVMVSMIEVIYADEYENLAETVENSFSAY